MLDCLFCKFVLGEVETEKVFENDQVIAFKDISPQAKEHYLFISKNHSRDFREMMENHPEDISHVYKAINEFASKNELGNDGFRIVTNTGKNAGQTVFHTHFHVIGGEKLGSFGS